MIAARATCVVISVADAMPLASAVEARADVFLNGSRRLTCSADLRVEVIEETQPESSP
jgi:hypothetical protein